MSLLGIGQQEEVGVTEILGPVQVPILPTDQSFIMLFIFPN
ncbi:MAG TPA: hypothetical protein PLV59_00370 [Candidatus Dojkabacteria bacterium]|nr:hypothetical protein [Candidatus Dojkabacteria bacterium]